MRFKKSITAFIMVLIFLGIYHTSVYAKVLTPTPESVVERFYDWYLQNRRAARENISEQPDVFEPELLKHLEMGFQKQPGDKNGWVDFDPFFDNQMGGDSVEILWAKVEGNTASVRVRVIHGRGSNSLKVYLRKSDGHWKIANFIYDIGFNLLSFLRNINR
jgi:ABC-type transporter MlaC component